MAERRGEDEDFFTSNDVPSDVAGPVPSPIQAVPHPSSPERVRRHLALLITYVLLIIYAAVLGVFLVSTILGGVFRTGELTAAIAAVSGLQGLAAAIVGFYFGVRERRDS